MEESTKPFWMKFYGRFFDKHEIKILLAMDRDYVFLYIALLLESVAHRGYIRYNERLAYSANMLSHLLNIPSQKVSESLKVLSDFDLVQVLDDGTIYLPAAPAMCGCGSDSAERMRKLRQKRKFGTTDDKVVRTCANMCEHVVTCDGSTEYRVQSTELRDKNKKNNKYYSSSSSPKPPKGADDEVGEEGIAYKSSDEFKHVSREYVASYFQRMKAQGVKFSDPNIEEEFWQHLVMSDFKKVADGMPITNANVQSSFKAWNMIRQKEIRQAESEKSEKQKIADEEQRKTDRAELMRANSFKFETDF